MNGPHDMGGHMNFGPVRPEPNEPVFHAPWEARALAVTLAAGALGQWNIDMSRSARESLAPLDYLSSSYYEIWIKGLERLLMARGLLSPDELAHCLGCEPAPQPRPVSERPGHGMRVLSAAAVPAALAAGSPSARAAVAPALFTPGQTVRARKLNPTGHTRLPRYVRGCVGTVTALHGMHVFPDSHARGEGECPQWLYTVEFAGHEVWGPQTTADSICVDCWESYLEAVVDDGKNA